MNMSTLHLTLKKKWFDMIASEEKKEEYREVKPYWIKRVFKHPEIFEVLNNTCIECIHRVDVNNIVTCGLDYSQNFKCNKDSFKWPIRYFKEYQYVTFKNGYAKNAPTITLKCLGISIGKAVPEWSDNWQGDVFVIKLGDKIK